MPSMAHLSTASCRGDFRIFSFFLVHHLLVEVEMVESSLDVLIFSFDLVFCRRLVHCDAQVKGLLPGCAASTKCLLYGARSPRTSF